MKTNLNIFGVFLVVFSAIAYSSITFLVAGLKKSSAIDIYNIVFLKIFFSFFISLPFSFKMLRMYLFEFKLIFASCLYVCTIFFFYSAISSLGPNIATAILFTYPFFVFILTSIDNRCFQLKSFITSVACVFGCYLVLLSKEESLSSISLTPFFASFTYGLYIFFAGKFKYGNKTEHISIIFLYGSLIFFFLFFNNVDTKLIFSLDLLTFTLILLVSALSFLAAFSLLKGIQHIGPNHASLISSLEPGFTVLLSMSLVFSSFDLYALLGVCLIILGNIIYAFDKRGSRTSTSAN